MKVLTSKNISMSANTNTKVKKMKMIVWLDNSLKTYVKSIRMVIIL